MITRLKPANSISEFETLEKAYRRNNRIWQAMIFCFLFALMLFLAFTLFGAHIDGEKLTTEVTPVHIELNPITGRSSTAQNPGNLQL